MNLLSNTILATIFTFSFSTNILASDLSLPSLIGADTKAANTADSTSPVTTEKNTPSILTDEEKTSLKDLRNLLDKQPQNLKDEISLYRSFIEKLKKEKQDYYDELSPEAKDFLKDESQLKDKLSTKALQEYYKKKLFK
jgi:hypothetical protein